MPIPLLLLDRITTSAMSGQQVAAAFARLAEVADKAGIDGCAVNLEYIRDEDRVLAGDLIPTITFSLKRQQRSVEPMPTDAIDAEPRP